MLSLAQHSYITNKPIMTGDELKVYLLAGTFGRGIAWPIAAQRSVGFCKNNWRAAMAYCPLLQGTMCQAWTHGCLCSTGLRSSKHSLTRG